jgi:hypothetical protein
MYDPGTDSCDTSFTSWTAAAGCDDALEPGVELVDGGGRYRVVRVEPAPNPQAFGPRLGGADQMTR